MRIYVYVYGRNHKTWGGHANSTREGTWAAQNMNPGPGRCEDMVLPTWNLIPVEKENRTNFNTTCRLVLIPVTVLQQLLLTWVIWNYTFLEAWGCGRLQSTDPTVGFVMTQSETCGSEWASMCHLMLSLTQIKQQIAENFALCITSSGCNDMCLL